MALPEKKKGVSMLAISFGKKPPMDDKHDEGSDEEESASEDMMDSEGMIKDDLTSALKSRDGAALYDAIVAVVEKCKGDE
jgi:hypothetical protein